MNQGTCKIQYFRLIKGNVLFNFCDVLFVQEWTVVVASGGPWPDARNVPSAISLYDCDANPSDPVLMVMWGWDGGTKVLSDNWLFNINAQQWKMVRQSVFRRYSL